MLEVFLFSKLGLWDLTILKTPDDPENYISTVSCFLLLSLKLLLFFQTPRLRLPRGDEGGWAMAVVLILVHEQISVKIKMGGTV